MEDASSWEEERDITIDMLDYIVKKFAQLHATTDIAFVLFETLTLEFLSWNAYYEKLAMKILLLKHFHLSFMHCFSLYNLSISFKMLFNNSISN